MTQALLALGTIGTLAVFILPLVTRAVEVLEQVAKVLP